THGSMVHRKPQSAGATDAARIFKNTGRPGHMGHERVTVKRLRVVRVDLERNMILVRGAVPGPNGGLLAIRGAEPEVRTAPLFDAAGQAAGEAELSDAVWGAPIREALVHQAVVRELANRRQGTADTKSRSEIRGGGKKPYRQKGTGRARQG